MMEDVVYLYENGKCVDAWRSLKSAFFTEQESAAWSTAPTAQDVFCLKTKEAASVPLDIILTSVTKVSTVCLYNSLCLKGIYL